MKHRYNDQGICIDQVEPELSSLDFGSYKEDGSLEIYWEEESESVDRFGFDKRNVEDNGQYIKKVELLKGMKLCRYGSNNGRMTTLQGSQYEYLGLPFKKETLEYHEYVVEADGIVVKCIVTRGKTAGMFDSPGGAVQFLHQRSMNEEILTGRLREEISWLRRKN